MVDADLPLRDLAVETGWPLATQTTETVEKWALRHWGHVPHSGDKLHIEGYQLIATEVSVRRIRRVRIIREAIPQPADADASMELPA